MHWIHFTEQQQLKDIICRSHEKPQVIFKHSTRCSLSSLVLKRLQQSKAPINADFHFLDLIAYRDVSNKVSTTFNIDHESPQILLIKDGICVYSESHLGIEVEELLEQTTATVC